MTTLRKAPEKSTTTALARRKASLRRVRPIRVMISSRNKDLIRCEAGKRKMTTLLNVRKKLQEELEGVEICGHRLFDVWINEEAGAESGAEPVWDICREKLDEAHIIIVLYNGEAGWRRQGTGIGICHEEIKYALDHFPAKLYLIEIPSTAPDTPANRAFADFMKKVNRWQEQAGDAEALQEKVRLAVAKAVSDLTITGSREGRKGRYYFGSPLDWSRLGYLERKARIEAAATGYLLDLGLRELAGPEPAEGAPGLVWELNGAQLLLLVHGVPSSFGIAEARELVGRPFLFDHTTPVATGGGLLAGPVHIIACHRSCSESRIFSFLGHPDVYIVQTPFGFFATDLSSFVQTFFLTNCRDRDSTIMALQRMFEWIAEADEAKPIVARARSRQRILSTVRAEIDAQAIPRSVRTMLAELETALPPYPMIFNLLPQAAAGALPQELSAILGD